MKYKLTSKVVALLIAVIVPIAGVAGLPGAAWARSTGAYAGHPLDNTPRSCYSENGGAVKYIGGPACPLHGRWQVLLPVDTAGAKAVTVKAHRGDDFSLAVQCQAVAMTPSGTVSSSSGNGTTAEVSAWGTITLAGANVPAGGYLFVVCFNLATGSEVGAIDWVVP